MLSNSLGLLLPFLPSVVVVIFFFSLFSASTLTSAVPLCALMCAILLTIDRRTIYALISKSFCLLGLLVCLPARRRRRWRRLRRLMSCVSCISVVTSKNGCTQVHEFACSKFGQSGLHECGCPRMFAAATVDSYVGMLRALFNDIGHRFHHNPIWSTLSLG